MGIEAALIGAGASLLGGAMSADAAGDAAAAQAASADRATQLQKEMFDKQVELNAPFRDAGLAAQNRLMYLLGLSPAAVPTMDYNSLRAELLPQFSKEVYTPGYSLGNDEGSGYYPGGTSTTVDEAALNAAIQQRMQQSQPQPANPSDPAFGSLMRDFGMQDFQADPGYAFRQSEGMKALERSAAARGGLMSGRAMKDTMRFGQDLASQEYGNAFNRFQTNRANKLNPLQSLSGVAQSATNQVANAAGNYANAAGGAMMAGGNARASGYVGQANAINDAIGAGFNRYQSGQLMNRLYQPPSAGGGMMPGYGNVNPFSGEFYGSLEF